MAERRPKLKLIVAHQGSGREDLSRKLAARMQELSNLYTDLCGSTRNSLSLADMVELMGEDRILFASDMCDVDPRYEFGKAAFSSVSDEVKKKIFGGNYLRILEKSQLGKIVL